MKLTNEMKQTIIGLKLHADAQKPPAEKPQQAERQHTPGPWRVGDNGNTVFGPPMGLPPLIVANCDYQQTRAGGSKKANARLIAAAPDLLEALKYAQKLIEVARRHFPVSMHHSDKFQLENTCATIGKAIAKAEVQS